MASWIFFGTTPGPLIAEVSIHEYRVLLSARANQSHQQNAAALEAAIQRLSANDSPVVILELSLLIARELEFRNHLAPSLATLYAAGAELAKESNDSLRALSFRLRAKLQEKNNDRPKVLSTSDVDLVWSVLETQHQLVSKRDSTNDLDRWRHVSDIFRALQYANGYQGSPEYVFWAKRLVSRAQELRNSFPQLLVEAQRQLAIVLASHGDSVSSRQLLRDAISLAEVERPQSLFILYMTLSWVEEWMGEHSAASKSLDVALPLRSANAVNASVASRVVLRGAKLKQILGEWERAAELLSDAKRETPEKDHALRAMLDGLLALQHLRERNLVLAKQKIHSGQDRVSLLSIKEGAEPQKILDIARLRLAVAENTNPSVTLAAIQTLSLNQRKAQAEFTPQLDAVIALMDSTDSAVLAAASERNRASASLNEWQARRRQSTSRQLLAVGAATLCFVFFVIFTYRRYMQVIRD